ncbi:hypothetical protein [Psychromicrobium xiongbiense]|uniref:hypothetical protein n=1 Tax=Psychromicrobium xiongbiense TaxID=3051184 RepID=UPI002554C4CA|nr:hypothetical protein [Psychromicrobium sp. YIM S02556]
MSIDARVALVALTTALEEHLAAAMSRRGEDDPAVEAAYLAIADAFDVYEEALYEGHGEVTPLVIYDEESAEDDDDDLDDEDDENADDDEDDEADEDASDSVRNA